MHKIFIFFSILLTILTGCTRTVYVPAETVRTDSAVRYVDRAITDTVRDTRLVWLRGDTVIDIRDREHVRRVEVHDTCYIERVHTVRRPYPVEHTLSRWEQTKMDLGGMALGAVAVVLCAAVVWLIKKFRR